MCSFYKLFKIDSNAQFFMIQLDNQFMKSFIAKSIEKSTQPYQDKAHSAHQNWRHIERTLFHPILWRNVQWRATFGKFETFGDDRNESRQLNSDQWWCSSWCSPLCSLPWWWPLCWCLCFPSLFFLPFPSDEELLELLELLEPLLLGLPASIASETIAENNHWKAYLQWMRSFLNQPHRFAIDNKRDHVASKNSANAQQNLVFE